MAKKMRKDPSKTTMAPQEVWVDGVVRGDVAVVQLVFGRNGRKGSSVQEDGDEGLRFDRPSGCKPSYKAAEDFADWEGGSGGRGRGAGDRSGAPLARKKLSLLEESPQEGDAETQVREVGGEGHAVKQRAEHTDMCPGRGLAMLAMRRQLQV